MGWSATEVLNVTSDPCLEVNNQKVVERQLEETCVKLSEVEVNIRLFSKMKKNGVATNDVRCFVAKQAKLKSSNHRVNIELTKKAMKSKFIDACNQARRLRHRKAELSNLLRNRFNYSGKMCRKLIKRTLGKAANHRHNHIKKAKKKYTHCENKMQKDRDRGDFKDIPWEAWELLQGVNLFNGSQLSPEPKADPMICSPDISLSKDELAFLKRGPRFMMRQEMNEKEFRAELEKMTVKAKLNDLNNIPTNDESSSSLDSSVSLTEEAERECAKAAMVYLKSEKALDLSKLKATDYKFNKHIYLPKHDSTEKEARHEARRLAMLEVFRQVCKIN